MSEHGRKAGMPLFLFHIYNGEITRDEEGQDLPDFEAARRVAIKAAREMIGEEARHGKVNLSHRIEVEDEIGLPCFTIRFRDAIEVEG